jgi:hypothetical protein|tara:strand:+ start:223 stop:522 length:300 start_codon:yes stop_codon:yes gene_type:complete
MISNYIQVKRVLFNYWWNGGARADAIKPTIDRMVEYKEYSVAETQHFYRVINKHRVKYFAKGKSPFHNRVYRLVSRPDSPDYIIRPVRLACLNGMKRTV